MYRTTALILRVTLVSLSFALGAAEALPTVVPLQRELQLSEESRDVKGNGLASESLVDGRTATGDRPRSGPVHNDTVASSSEWYDRTIVRLLAAILGALGISGLMWLRTRAAVARSDALQQEVNRRSEAEDRLRTSEERSRRLFDAAPVALVAWDPGGNVMDFNARASDLFGWTKPEALSQTISAQFENPDLALAAFARVTGGTEELTVLASIKPSSGDPRVCRWHFAPVFDNEDAGALQMVITLVTDLADSERATQDHERVRERIARAEESERSLIARELHDDLSQRLAALAIDAHLAGQSVGMSELVGAETLRQFQLQVESISADVQALSRKLHPTIVDDLGLLSALRSECGRWSRQSGIRVNLEAAPGIDEPDSTTSLALFRIAQESMQNAWKHGEATTIKIQLELAGDDHVLKVEDNGSGFAEGSKAGAETGIGLASMRERIGLVGGTLKIESAPGEGTRITARAPSRPAGHGS